MNIDPRNIISGNGGGLIKSRVELQPYLNSAAKRVSLGSATVLKRLGNIPGSGVLYIHPVLLWAMNALGLPNMGMERWELELPRMLFDADQAEKDLVFSVAGFTPEEYGELTSRAIWRGVHIIQLNLSCRNVWGPAGNKPIAAENPEIVEQILRHVAATIPTGHHPQIEAKVSPNQDPKLIHDIASVIKASGIITRVVAGNAKGGQRRIKDDGTEALNFYFDESDKELKHEGAVSGSELTDETPKLVEAYVRELGPLIGVIAAGGIFNGAHLEKNLAAGAIGWESTTACLIDKPRHVFSNIYDSLPESITA